METLLREAHVNKGGWNRGGLVIEPNPEGKLPAPHDFIGLANMGYGVDKVAALRTLRDGSIATVPNQFHLVRSDDEASLADGTVTERYAVVTPADIADLLDPFHAEGYGNMDSAFTLYDGRGEVLSFRLDFNENVAGDDAEYDNFLIAYNLHGSGALRLKCVRFRPRCKNFFGAGMRNCDMKMVHTKSIHDKLAFARNYWQSARDVITEHSRKLGLLMTLPCDLSSTIDKVLGIDGKPVDDVSTQKTNLKADIILAAHNPVNFGTEGPSTFGAVFQAITFLASNGTKGKGRKNEQDRMESQLDGTLSRDEEKAWDKLCELAAI